jgi:type I protein arginine methyltransferase
MTTTDPVSLQEWANAWPSSTSSASSASTAPDSDYYFNSYAHFGIHEDMISDVSRTSAYQQAIIKSSKDLKDKIVLDIGAGSGILSMFAVKAGAKHVYALECSSICDLGRQIVAANGMSDKITFIQGKAEEVTLPVETVDVIISEWMGYALIYESMLDTVIYCRDKHLKKQGGMMFPDKARIFIAGISDFEFRDNSKISWKSVYGIKMDEMSTQVMQEAMVDVFAKESLVTNEFTIAEWDLLTVTVPELDFTSKFELTVSKKDRLDGILCWFDNGFPGSVILSTSPSSRPTHWKQTAFYLEEEQYVQEGEKVTGNFSMKKSKPNPRDIDVKVAVDGGHEKVYRIR